MSEELKNEETFSSRFTTEITGAIEKYNEKMDWMNNQPEDAMTNQEKDSKQIAWLRDVKYLIQDFENQLTQN